MTDQTLAPFACYSTRDPSPPAALFPHSFTSNAPSRLHAASGDDSAMKADLSDAVIYLRPFIAGDLLGLHGATRESIDMLCAWMTWCQPAYAIADCQSFLGQAAADWETDKGYNFAIIDALDQGL